MNYNRYVKSLIYIVLCCISSSAFAQIQITVPSGTDTAVCAGTPVTMHANSNGRVPTISPLNQDDFFSDVIDIGFPFTFYGNTYTQCVISANGYINFNLNNANNSTPWDIVGPIPGNPSTGGTTASPGYTVYNSIMAAYSDINPGVAGGTIDYSIVGTAPNRKFVVSFCDVPMYECTNLIASFQIVIYETTNVIDIHIANQPSCPLWPSSGIPGVAIEGVQNIDGTLATVVPGRNYPTQWTAYRSSNRFTPNGPNNYTLSTIPFSPIPDSSATINWYTSTGLVGSGHDITVTPTATTTYYALVTQCQDTLADTVTVIVNPLPVISGTAATNPSQCQAADGTITLHGLTANATYTITYTYNGNPVTVTLTANASGDVIITGLMAGTYSNIIAATQFCTSAPAGPVTLVDPTVTISGTAFTNPTVCDASDGTITLHGLVPNTSYTITYTLNGIVTSVTITSNGTGDVIVTGLAAGTYSNITAATVACVSAPVGPITLTNPNPAISGTAHTDPTVCDAFDGTITIHGLLADTTYTISYILNGTTIQITVAADNNGDIILTGLTAGTYTNIIAHLHSCSSAPAGPVTLVNPNPVISGTASTDPSVCEAADGSITIQGLLADTTYTIHYVLNSTAYQVTLAADANGNITITGLTAGTYINIVAQLHSCSSAPVGPVTLTDPLPVISGTSFTNPTLCRGTDATLTLSGLLPDSNYTIHYFVNGIPHTIALVADGTGTILVTGISAGIYTNITAQLLSCQSLPVGPVTIVNPPVAAAFSYVLHPGCTQDTVLFTDLSSGSATPFTYSWQFGDGTTDTAANPIHIYHSQDTFHVVLNISDSICTDVTSQDVVVFHPLHAAFVTDHDTICQGSVIQFTDSSIGTAPLTYYWNFANGDTSLLQSPADSFHYTGTYPVSLVITDFIGCHDTIVHKVRVDSMSYVNILLSDSIICAGKAVLFSGQYTDTGSTGVIWDFGDGITVHNFDNQVRHSYEYPGNYTIHLTATYRVCPDTTATEPLIVRPYPAVDLGPDTAMCPNAGPIRITDVINAGNPQAMWQWSTGDTSSSILARQPGNYATTVTIDGCSTTDSIWVRNDCYIDIPNSFTPNGDGMNDYFLPRQLLSSGVTAFKMIIYNRWGQEIFATNHIDGRGWDGKFNDEVQPNGVYVYVIDVTMKNGTVRHYQGNVTLLR